MKCPKCPTSELVPARTSENDPSVDGFKCLKCDTLYRMNDSNHLVPIAFGAPKPIQKLTDADIKPGISQEGFLSVLKDVARPLKNDTVAEPTYPNDYHMLTEKDEAIIAKRLTAGDAPSLIAREMGFKIHQVRYYQCKLKKQGRLPTKERVSSLSEEAKASIFTRVQAGESTAHIMKALNCKSWQVYYYGSKPAGPPIVAHPMVFSQKRGGHHRLSEDQQRKMFELLVAGSRIKKIQTQIKCSDATIYAFIFQHEQELLAAGMKPRTHKKQRQIKCDAAKLANAWLDSPTIAPPTLTIRMANNGFVVTDMENAEFTYTRLPDLLQCITDFFGDPVPCNPTR